MCGKPTTAEFRPFCSRRCTDIDLGRWLGGRYAVPGEPIGRAGGEEPVSQEDEDAGC
ncbi:MAG TPA: DNA gyrase inhibitor YacG [Methyloceanibacter sp.]|nr:DNA gyrase inhibitor YacG [Methyloceanibacter sp.]